MINCDALIKRKTFGSSSVEYGLASSDQYYVEVYYDSKCLIRQLYKHRSSAIRCFNSYCVRLMGDVKDE